MRLNADRVYIRALNTHDAESLLNLRVRNREFLAPYEPLTSDSHYTLQGQTEILVKVEENWQNQSGYGFGIFLTTDDKLVGRVNLSNVVRGAWESCTLGYFLDKEFNGRGLMTGAVRLVLQFAFEKAELHRVQAAVMPRNLGSIRVLEKAGFLYEGFAEYYLKIHGVWEHHNMYSITREHYQ